MKVIRLGVIGMSPGNGHPYSWSAICNGFNILHMKSCGFPVIPSYLSSHKYPEDFIQDAVVSHVWTQDLNLSRHIAMASNIENVVADFRDMVGHVDAILLARDDASMHLHFLKELLPLGLPVYVDKPLALSIDAAKKILSLQVFPGQVFSCSALRYANELCIDQQRLSTLGALRRIVGITPKNWNTYSPHIIEPIRSFYSSYFDKVIMKEAFQSLDQVTLRGICASGIEFELSAMGGSELPIQITLIGEESSATLVFKDSFNAFKLALRHFLDTSCAGIEGIFADDMLETVSLIEAGMP